MEEMKWSSSGFIAQVAANYLGFGLALALAEICQTFWPATAPRGHGMPKLSLTEHS